MYVDNLTLFSGLYTARNVLVPQTVTGTNTSVLGANSVDLNPSLGAANGGEAAQGLDVQFQVVTAPSGGTSVQFQLVQADDYLLTANVQVLAQTDAFPVASLPAGTVVPLRWSRVTDNGTLPKRYAGVRFVLAGAVATGAYVAALGADFQSLGTDGRGPLYRVGTANT